MNAEEVVQGSESVEEEAPKFFEATLIRVKLLGLRIAELAHEVRILVPDLHARHVKVEDRVEDTSERIVRSVETLFRGASDTAKAEVVEEVSDATHEKVKDDIADSEEHDVSPDFVFRLSEMASVVRAEWTRENGVFVEKLDAGLLTKSLMRKLDRLKKTVGQHSDEQIRDLVTAVQAAIEVAKDTVKGLKKFELPKDREHDDSWENPESEPELRSQYVKSQVATIRDALSVFVDAVEDAAEDAGKRADAIRNEVSTRARNPHIAALEEEDAPDLEKTEVFEALKRTLENEVVRWAERTYQSSGPRNSVLSDVEASASLLASSHRQLVDTEDDIAGIAYETKDFRRIRNDLLGTRKEITKLKKRLGLRKSDQSPESEAA